ncbi:MAG: hypothetical protein AAFR71_14765 [Pseudomonadota bacterium]
MRFFGHETLFLFKLAELGFIARDDGFIGGFDNACEKPVDFLIYEDDLLFGGFDDGVGLVDALVPSFPEHGGGQFHELGCWLKR